MSKGTKDTAQWRILDVKRFLLRILFSCFYLGFYLGYCSVAAMGIPMWAAAARTLALLAATASKCEIIGRNFTWYKNLVGQQSENLSQPACRREIEPRSRGWFFLGFWQPTSSIRSQESGQIQRTWKYRLSPESVFNKGWLCPQFPTPNRNLSKIGGHNCH